MTGDLLFNISGEVDKRLDRECEFIFSWNDSVFDLSEKYGLIAPGVFLKSENEIDIYYHITADPSSIYEMRNALIILQAENIGEDWVIKQRITDNGFLGALNEILVIPSVVLDMIMMIKGNLHMRFRFHHSVENVVSNYIMAQLLGKMDFSVHYLGKSRGFMNTLKDINDIMPLSMVRYSVTAPEYEKPPTKNPIGMKWERVRKYVRGDRILHYVYFGYTEPPAESQKYYYTISEKDHLYETVTGNDVITFINENSEKKRLVRIGALHFFDGTNLEIKVVISKSSVKDYLSVLSSAREKFPEWDLQLTGIY
ncbi:MAG: hypothetical protein AAE977_05610 [Thermoplasmataceae archaeon]